MNLEIGRVGVCNACGETRRLGRAMCVKCIARLDVQWDHENFDRAWTLLGEDYWFKRVFGA